MTRRVSLVFLLLLVTFSYFGQGGGANQNAIIGEIRSIAEEGHFYLDRFLPIQGDISRSGGHVYSNKTPSILFFAAPVYAAVYHGARLLGIDTAGVSYQLFAVHLITVLSASVWGALSGVLIYFLLGRLYPSLGERSKVGLSLGIPLSTLLFVYSTVAFVHAFETFWVLAAFLFWIRYAEQPTGVHALLMGASYGVSVLANPVWIVLAPLYLFGVLVPGTSVVRTSGADAARALDTQGLSVASGTPATARTTPARGVSKAGITAASGERAPDHAAPDSRAAISNTVAPGPAAPRGSGSFVVGARNLAGWTLGVVAALTPLLFYQWICFGDPLSTNRAHQDQGFTTPGLVLGVFDWPEWGRLFNVFVWGHRSIVPTQAYLLLALPGAAWIVRRRSFPIRHLVFVGSYATVSALFIACFNGWHGGSCFGPRYITPLLALMGLLTVPVFQAIPRVTIALLGFSYLSLLCVVSVFIYAPETEMHPFARIIWPHFLAGDLSRGNGYPSFVAERGTDYTFNLGTLLGLEGMLSLLPLLLVQIVLGTMLFFWTRDRTS